MTQPNNTPCARSMKHLDAFMDGELDPQTASEVQHHVQACNICSGEMSLRNKLRDRLRSAARDEAPAPFLQTRVVASIRQQQRRSPWIQRSAWASAAVLLLTVGLSVAYQLGHLRFTVESQNRYIDAMLQKVSLALGPGLADHIHCAVFRTYPKQAPGIEMLRADLAPEYRPVLEIVRAKVPNDYAVHMAHLCTFRDRKFVHIALKSDRTLLSLILTKRRTGETMARNELTPVISRAGVDFYGGSAQRFQMAGFETATHFAYVVSDASAQETHQLLLAMAPDLRVLIEKLPA